MGRVRADTAPRRPNRAFIQTWGSGACGLGLILCDDGTQMTEARDGPVRWSDSTALQPPLSADILDTWPGDHRPSAASCDSQPSSAPMPCIAIADWSAGLTDLGRS
ncbi:unnamed protein product [Gadus morhua 'NCC']